MKSKKIKKKVKKEKVFDPIPTPEPGMIVVPFTPVELQSFSNLLVSTAQMFNALALKCAEVNDETSFKIYSSKYNMLKKYAETMSAHVIMGEPESREVN